MHITVDVVFPNYPSSPFPGVHYGVYRSDVSPFIMILPSWRVNQQNMNGGGVTITESEASGW